MNGSDADSAGRMTCGGGSGTTKPSERSWAAIWSGVAHCDGGKRAPLIVGADAVATADTAEERTGADDMTLGARGPGFGSAVLDSSARSSASRAASSSSTMKCEEVAKSNAVSTKKGATIRSPSKMDRVHVVRNLLLARKTGQTWN